MHIAICDDDINAQSFIKSIINKWEKTTHNINDIKFFSCSEAFLMVWPETIFDLIFLDIEMKHMTGIELAKKIREIDNNIQIVFVTSHRQYVLSGYDVRAFHYLIKPIKPQKLYAILDNIYKLWRFDQESFVIISTENGQKKIMHNNIYYITKVIHTANIKTNDMSYETRKTLEFFEQELPDYFFRCHRSCIVNTYKIDCLYKDSLLLSDGTILPVSRNNIKSLRDAFMRLHMEKEYNETGMDCD